jgi:hypothetical protein
MKEAMKEWYSKRIVEKYLTWAHHLHNGETPTFVNIRTKYVHRAIKLNGENEIWDIEELKMIIKYEPIKRNKATLALLWDLNSTPKM